MRLLEAKKDGKEGFFTDAKGRVHPIEPSPEAIAYAKKMGFKHTIGGNPLNFAKVAAKNAINDAIVGATTGGVEGYAARRWPGAILGAGLGGAAGVLGSTGESLVKYKLLNKKPLSNQ